MGERVDEDFTSFGAVGIARAGTGKTTTALATLTAIVDTFDNLRIGYVAFNRRAADDAAFKAPYGVSVNTFHSLIGLAAIKATYKGTQSDSKKPMALAGKVLPKVADPNEERKLDTVRYALVKAYDLVMNHLLLPDDKAGFKRVCDFFGIGYKEFGEEMFFTKLSEMVHISTETLDIGVSYGDMVYAPVASRKVYSNVPRYDFLVVDEAQDLTEAQQVGCMVAVGFTPDYVAKRFGLPRRRRYGVLAVIGDDRQSIYGWRGALQDGIGNFRAMVEESGADIVTCPITRTRRCPKAVVRLISHKVVPDFAYEPDAPEGAVLGVSMQYVLDHIGEGRSDTLVLARTNADLVAFALKLVMQSVPVEFVSRDMGNEITRKARKFIWDYKEYHGTRPEPMAFATEMRSKAASLMDAKKGKSKARLEAQIDELNVLAAIGEVSEDWEEFFRNINSLFGSDIKPDMQKRAVKFSTIHGIKGGEADYVVIIGGDKMPHPLAEEPWEFQSEDNLVYVAATRAKDTLMIAGTVPAVLEGNPEIQFVD
jgi:hypothetical protein